MRREETRSPHQSTVHRLDLVGRDHGRKLGRVVYLQALVVVNVGCQLVVDYKLLVFCFHPTSQWVKKSKDFRIILETLEVSKPRESCYLVLCWQHASMLLARTSAARSGFVVLDFDCKKEL